MRKKGKTLQYAIWLVRDRTAFRMEAGIWKGNKGIEGEEEDKEEEEREEEEDEEEDEGGGGGGEEKDEKEVRKKEETIGEETQTGLDKTFICCVFPKDMGLPAICECILVKTEDARLSGRELLTRL